jgi:hypothetical protein
MYFKTSEHQNLFNKLVRKANQEHNSEYTAAIYTLAAIGKGVSNFVQVGGGIKFPALFKAAEAWSSGEKALLRLAATLFSAGTWPVAVDDVFYNLDQNNCRVAIQAIEIRYLKSGV